MSFVLFVANCFRRADVGEHTFVALWSASDADRSSVMDHPMRKHYPMFLRDKLSEIVLDLLGRFVLGEAEQLGNARDVCVDDNSGRDAKRIAEDDVRRLAGDAAEREQLNHRLRNLAVKYVDHPLTRGLNILCFVSKKTGRVNVLFEFLLRNCDEISRTVILTKKVGGDNIDAYISTLRREDRRDQQFERIGVNESAMSVGISLFQAPDDLGGSFFLIGDHYG